MVKSILFRTNVAIVAKVLIAIPTYLMLARQRCSYRNTICWARHGDFIDALFIPIISYLLISSHNNYCYSLQLMQTALLSSTYFGPIQWYQKLFRYQRCIVEQHDNFIKQTYRNRCVISATQGVQALSIPVEPAPQTSANGKVAMKDVRISDHGNWRHLHWNALTSAYGESPFFEYYEDDIRPFFEKQYTFLLDFNMETTAKMCELLDIEPNIVLSEEYLSADALTQSSTNGDVVSDFRDAIRPKRPLEDVEFSPKPYYQVFSQKHGFLPNLSILDLLFNEGNESVLFL